MLEEHFPHTTWANLTNVRSGGIFAIASPSKKVAADATHSLYDTKARQPRMYWSAQHVNSTHFYLNVKAWNVSLEVAEQTN